ncbi:MAG: CPBP family intramembrane metalloprotease [Erysipelotrichaceae bacterium]|nr:CPBP family intramembrane metalloprotease [Erysipelotrichaceae bacterium]
MKGKKVISWPASIAIVVHYALGYGLLYPAAVRRRESQFLLYYQERMIINTGIYAFVFLVTVIPVLPVLKYGWNKLTDSYAWNLRKIFNGELRMFALLGISALLLHLFGLENSRNQAEIHRMLLLNPYYYSLLVSVFAPFVEETVFRVCIFARLKESGMKIPGYLVSAVSFGFIHIMDSFIRGYFWELPFIIPYSLLGFVLAYVYDRTDSVWCSILLHMLHNSLSLLLGA